MALPGSSASAAAEEMAAPLGGAAAKEFGALTAALDAGLALANDLLPLTRAASLSGSDSARTLAMSASASASSESALAAVAPAVEAFLAAATAAVPAPKLRAAVPRPRVGVAAFLRCPAAHPGCVLVGARAGSHGAGRVATPGGHLEAGDSWEATAARELAEETGLELSPSRFTLLTVTNDVMPADGLHYVTLFLGADLTPEEAADIRNTEPDKCLGWEWLSRDELASRPLFVPMQNLLASPAATACFAPP